MNKKKKKHKGWVDWPVTLGKAIRMCHRRKLYLLQEGQPGRPGEQWIIYSKETGRQLAIWHPQTTNLCMGNEPIIKMPWERVPGYVARNQKCDVY